MYSEAQLGQIRARYLSCRKMLPIMLYTEFSLCVIKPLAGRNKKQSCYISVLMPGIYLHSVDFYRCNMFTCSGGYVTRSRYKCSRKEICILILCCLFSFTVWSRIYFTMSLQRKLAYLCELCDIACGVEGRLLVKYRRNF